MEKLKLYMILLGCKPEGRNTEQHDIFFGIGTSLKDLVPSMRNFWKEAQSKLHIDAWREVNYVDGHHIAVKKRKDKNSPPAQKQLFFINLGGYRKNEFEEYHYKILTVAADKGKASQKAKQTAFYQHFGFEGAVSHIDDKYGIDVDDIYPIEDILDAGFKNKYTLHLSPAPSAPEDQMHIGYLKLEKVEKEKNG